MSQYVPMVWAIVARYRRRVPAWVQTDELFAAGLEGAFDAAKRFDPSRGIRFSTFAGPRVHGAIADWIRTTDYVPRSRRRAGKAPLLHSMDQVLTEGAAERLSYVNAQASRDQGPLHDAISNDRWTWLMSLLSTPQARACDLHYRKGLTLFEVGESMGLSESRACQLVHKAHARLRIRLEHDAS